MSPRELLLASSNKGKLAEFNQCFADMAVTLVPQSALNIKAADETGLTFVENALLKARHGARQSGLPTLADDAGLVVDALGGAPGIYSARYAGVSASDADNVAKLLQALTDVPEDQRIAHFHCTLVYLSTATDPDPIICQARWYGRVLRAPQGHQGFGYDPIFYVPTHDCSAAQLPSNLKNALSHRGQAVQRMRQYLSTE